MAPTADYMVRQLQASDVTLMNAMMTAFGKAFNEGDTYTGARPGTPYLERLLGGSQLIALAALRGGAIVGGLVAYELQKFERERSEIYIYDLAVVEAHRRRGIATALIEKLKTLALERTVYAVFVQADREDAAAIAFYDRLGLRKEVLHFDIGIGSPANPDVVGDPGSGRQ
jgi:aminoglycoside 3-N-acetyltransferase I